MTYLDHIDVVPNFPKAGINFYDIQSVLTKPDVWQSMMDDLTAYAKDKKPDVIVGIESRGFLTGLPVAQALGLPFGMVRKAGKLPGDTIAQTYALEYGEDTIEIQKSLLNAGSRVLIMDDLLATGGTAKACGDLIRQSGAEILGLACIIELPELGGRAKLDFDFHALVQAPLDPFVTTQKTA